MKIKNYKDFMSGVMFIAFGAFFAILARGYQMGTPAKMGSGYFPFWLGVILGLLGLAVLLKSIAADTEDSSLGKWDWKSVAWVTGSVLVFAVLLPLLGLVIALVALVYLSALASHEFNWKQTFVNALILIVIAYGAFVWGLKLQFPVWPPFLTN